MKLGLSKVKSSDKFDYVLLALLVIMAITSCIAIYASFSIVGTSTGMHYLSRQIMWFTASFIVFSMMLYLGNDSLFQFAKYAYWILMICLVILFVFRILYKLGMQEIALIQDINGAVSWFTLPGFSFQPSEFMKIVLIVITAQIIDDHNKNKTTDSFELDFKLFIEIAKWALPPMILILLQPDTGVVLIIGISLLAMVLCSGIHKEWLWLILGLFALFAIIFGILYFFNYDLLLNIIGKDNAYKLDRITSWLDPESNFSHEGYQQYLGLVSIGSAGIKGHGLHQALLKIPEAHTDYIFAVVSQTWGLIGGGIIILLCLLLDLHLCKIASSTNIMFEKYCIIGIIGMLLFQQVQNMGMIVGLLPITGITLPLISYGGSSIISYFIAFGITMNASLKS